jgi:hypothetical protein
MSQQLARAGLFDSQYVRGELRTSGRGVAGDQETQRSDGVIKARVDMRRKPPPSRSLCVQGHDGRRIREDEVTQS